MEKIVLAYSGGVDTSVIIPWLKENYNANVIAFIADIGQREDWQKLVKKAKDSGASKVYIEDLKKEFLEKYAFFALKAQAKYEGKYLLSTALSRPLIASYLVKIAKKENTYAVCHGCSGKGNDQVRFELAIKSNAPNLKIIAPLREWSFKSRKQELEYAKKKKIPIKATKKSPYSIDENIWGVSIECGKLEDEKVEPPMDSYISILPLEKAANRPTYVEIEFYKGTPVGVNGKRMDSTSLVKYLNNIGAKHSIGRIDMIENRLIGIKSREIYEAPAATILYLAHQHLEELVLDKELLNFKRIVSLKYAQLIYEGFWQSSLKKALDKFIEQTQKNVTGKIKLKLYKGNVSITKRQSIYSLYSKDLATYSEKDVFPHNLAEGFIYVWGLPLETESKLRKKIKE